MPLRLNGSTSGYSELSAPAVAGNNTITLPTGNGTAGQHLQGDGAGGLSWGVGVSSDSQLCKAWVNFNGTGTVAIRASYNVSSITDNGVGDYTVNFTAAMVDANYSVVANSSTDGTYLGISININSKTIGGNAVVSPTTTATRMVNLQPNIGAVDSSYMCVSIFR